MVSKRSQAGLGIEYGEGGLVVRFLAFIFQKTWLTGFLVQSYLTLRSAIILSITDSKNS